MLRLGLPFCLNVKPGQQMIEKHIFKQINFHSHIFNHNTILSVARHIFIKNYIYTVFKFIRKFPTLIFILQSNEALTVVCSNRLCLSFHRFDIPSRQHLIRLVRFGLEHTSLRNSDVLLTIT